MEIDSENPVAPGSATAPSLASSEENTHYHYWREEEKGQNNTSSGGDSDGEETTASTRGKGSHAIDDAGDGDVSRRARRRGASFIDKKELLIDGEAGLDVGENNSLEGRIEMDTGCPKAGGDVALKLVADGLRVAGSATAEEEAAENTQGVILKDGKVVPPTFPRGGVSVHNITCTSVLIKWSKPIDIKYPVYAYRVCTAEVGKGFEVTYSEASSFLTEAIVVGLKPGELYQFYVAVVSTEKLLVPGSSAVSSPIRLPKASYEEAWFFEEGKSGIKWTAYEGVGPDCVKTLGGGGGYDSAPVALNALRCSPSRDRCYTGLQSLHLSVAPEFDGGGGAYVDTTVKGGRLYIVRARVFHEKSTSDDKEELGTNTRLLVWDTTNVKEASTPSTKRGEWELLECKIVPAVRSRRLRIAIHIDAEYQDDIYVDAVEVHHGGSTPSELAIMSLVEELEEPRSLSPSKVLIRVESARNLKASDSTDTFGPFVKVMIGNIEIYRTKVSSITTSPVWDETFFALPETSGDADGVTEGIRFEIWDDNIQGGGDYYLGEVKMAAEEVAAAPPHRVEHVIVYGRPSGSTITATEDNSANPNSSPKKSRVRFLGSGRRGNSGFARAHPSFLALALLVSWPKNLNTIEGTLVATLLSEGPLPARVKALKARPRGCRFKPEHLGAWKSRRGRWASGVDRVVSVRDVKGHEATAFVFIYMDELSRAALKEHDNIADAARGKEALIRSGAPQAAVWVLPEPAFLKDACHLLMGLVHLPHDVKRTDAGFNLCRRLQAYVLLQSPTIVTVRCLHASIRESEILLALLEKLYIGRQATLREDVVSIPGFFFAIVVHVDDAASSQSLMREISRGSHDFPPGLTSLFRQHRRRIPAIPGLWKISVLEELLKEEDPPPDLERGGLEAEGVIASLELEKQQRDASLRTAVITESLRVAMLLTIPLCLVVVGGNRVGSRGSCEQPIGTLILADGLLLLQAVLGRTGAGFIPRRLKALPGVWIYSIILFTVVAHVGFVMGLLVAITKVDSVGTVDKIDGNISCSTGTFALGVFVLILEFICLLALSIFACVRCWHRVTKSPPPAFVLAAAQGEAELAYEPVR